MRDQTKALTPRKLFEAKCLVEIYNILQPELKNVSLEYEGPKRNGDLVFIDSSGARPEKSLPMDVAHSLDVIEMTFDEAAARIVQDIKRRFKIRGYFAARISNEEQRGNIVKFTFAGLKQQPKEQYP